MTHLPKSILLVLGSLSIIISCTQKTEEKSSEKELVENEFIFKETNPELTGVKFKNSVFEDELINYLVDENVYNGSGLAIGDINNDGLPEIYFGGNSSEDKLYLNQGGFKFIDISKSSGISKFAKGWTTGVNMIDINSDGLLDIYVCRSSPIDDDELNKNKLFINNGDNSFIESSEEYGLDFSLQSRQSSFFDYDQDGDLDMYLLNKPEIGFKAGEIAPYLNAINSHELFSDRFFENVEGKFMDKTNESGLFNFGYGHNVSVGDINNDGYVDIYVSLDFDDPDKLFINNKDKTFREATIASLNHVSWSSMGTDIADINNDGLNDIYVLDMAPEDHIRSKVNMRPMNVAKFNALVAFGEQHQYMFNTLQLNRGNEIFSEIAQMAGIAKTDWSWAPLFLDIDLDGNKDLFISNGIKRNFQYRDLGIKLEELTKKLGRKPTFDDLYRIIPTEITDNVVYRNTDNLHFDKASKEWVSNLHYNSNGVSYGDLDADGDLDLVTNNMEAIASVFENKSVNNKLGSYLNLKFKGNEKNPFAIGTKVFIESGEKVFFQELYPVRGYLSSMNYELVFGLGKLETIEKMKVIWPDNSISIFENLETNQTLTLDYSNLKKSDFESENVDEEQLLKISSHNLGIDFQHKEDPYQDYKEQILLPFSQSKNGPFMDKADVNDDGLEDFFIGGAAGQGGALFVQNANGTFRKSNSWVWEADKAYEDLGILFFDADQDKDQDLYIVSGGASFNPNAAFYQDRLYLNDGNGNFIKSINGLPEIRFSGQAICSNDIDNDGDLDLFIGGRIIPEKYPYPPESAILINENGKFVNKTSELAPYFKNHSMVSDALFSDFDGDGDEDLITVGEWSKVDIHENNNGIFTLLENPSLSKTRGMWFSINEFDIDGDGDKDYICGNIGLNTKFKANKKKEFHVYCDDFDQSGSYDIVLSSNYKGNLVPVRGRECSSDQMPFIKNKFESYQSFAEANITDIYGRDQLDSALHYQIDFFQSVLLMNKGRGKFEMVDLPMDCQMAPLIDIEIVDINGDKSPEILGIGNHFDVEVETVRFDASIGFVLEYKDGKFKKVNPAKSGFYVNTNSKNILTIKDNLIISNSNDEISIYKVLKPVSNI